MRPPLRCIIAVLPLSLLVACGDNDAGPPQTIAEHVRADDRFSTLESVLEAAGQLDPLDQPGSFTLFAPTDSGWDAALAALGIEPGGLLDLPQLEDLAAYHVHGGALTTGELERLTAITTVSGPEIHVRFGLDGVLLNDGVSMTAEPIVASNGIIHVLDAVLTRPLETVTRRYERVPDVELADTTEELFGFTDDFLTVEDTGFIHDLRVFVEVEHTDVSQLIINLEHMQTGTRYSLVRAPASQGNDIQITFADSAAADIIDDVVATDDVDAKAFPQAAYRPREPLEFALGQQLDGVWHITILDFRAGETGRLVRWGFEATFGDQLPAPAIVFNRRATSAPVMTRGFTETPTMAVRRVGALEGELELDGQIGEIGGEPSQLTADARVGSVMFEVARDAALGPRDGLLWASGGPGGRTSRAMHIESAVVDPDASGVELLAHIPLPRLGAGGLRGNDIWGWTDPLSGAEIALVGTSAGTAFVDISAPDAPVVLGTLPTASFTSDWRDIKVHADHAFIVSEAPEHGLQIFDLTQLRGITAPQTFAVTAHTTDFGNAHNIAINEDTGFAYVVGSDFSEACSGGLLMYDLSTPLAPVSLGCFAGAIPAGQAPGPEYPSDVYTHDVQCVTYAGPDLDHQGSEVCFSSDEVSVGIADVTTKASPAQLSRISYPGVGYTHQGWLTEDHRYFVLNDEFDEFVSDLNTRSYVFDVTDLDAPTLLGVIDNPRDAVGHNTYIVGDIAYQANYTSGLRLVDISSIATGTGTEIGYFDTYPSDDGEDDGVVSRCNTSAGARLLPHPTDVDTPIESGCGNVKSFRGAWSSYPFFASGAIVVSDIDRGLFVLRRD